jgi:hypothetical protein
MIHPAQRGVNEIVAHCTAWVSAARQPRRQLFRRDKDIVIAQRRLQGTFTVDHQITVVQQTMDGQHSGNAQPPGSQSRLKAKQIAQMVQVNDVGAILLKQTQQRLGSEEAQRRCPMHRYHAGHPFVTAGLTGVAAVQILVGDDGMTTRRQRPRLQLLGSARKRGIEAIGRDDQNTHT